MKRFLCSLLFLIVTGGLKSQVTVEQNRYLPVSFTASNIFDVDLTNLDGTTYNGYLTGTIVHVGRVHYITWNTKREESKVQHPVFSRSFAAWYKKSKERERSIFGLSLFILRLNRLLLLSLVFLRVHYITYFLWTANIVKVLASKRAESKKANCIVVNHVWNIKDL